MGWPIATATRRVGAALTSLVAFLAIPVCAQTTIRLTDVTADTGITFRHTDGSGGNRYIVESVSAGLALFDYNGDELIDIYFLNGAPLRGTRSQTSPRNALYRNEGHWRFIDVTDEAGVGDTGFGLGVAVGDYDNDGDLDLYVNNFGPNVLYRNNGDGTFTDVTDQAGVANGHRVGAGVCFLDIDADGDLDLYVSNYVKFSYESHRPHHLMGIPAYPSPLNYEPDPDTLYRNNGDGTFTDISVESGIASSAGTGMGIVSFDYDQDGDTDVFVCNDVNSNFLFQNDGNGHFTEVALLSGTALDLGGIPHGSMGSDCRDFDNDGLLDLYVTSYSGELATLYRNLGGGFFEDATRITGAGSGTFPHVTWGNGFVDFDNDGDQDLYIACGHIDDNVELRDDTASYLARNLLLMNTGNGRFVDVSAAGGDGLAVKLCSRGTAFDDLDGDGDIDVVVLNSRREPTVLRNDTATHHHWLHLRTRGTKANRDGIGARVTLVAGPLQLADEVHSGRGYQSHHGMRLHFGLATQQRIDRLVIRWIGGGVDVFEGVAVDQLLTVVEGQSHTAGP